MGRPVHPPALRTRRQRIPKPLIQRLRTADVQNHGNHGNRIRGHRRRFRKCRSSNAQTPKSPRSNRSHCGEAYLWLKNPEGLFLQPLLCRPNGRFRTFRGFTDGNDVHVLTIRHSRMLVAGTDTYWNYMPHSVHAGQARRPTAQISSICHCHPIAA